MFRKIKTRAAVAVISMMTALAALSVPGVASAESMLGQTLRCSDLQSAGQQFLNQAGEADAAGNTKLGDSLFAQAKAMSAIIVATCGNN